MNNYAMFSDKGNALVDRVVNEARVQGWGWAQVCRHLALLARTHPRVAGEAYDTAVREVVYQTLGFVKQDESFYC